MILRLSRLHCFLSHTLIRISCVDQRAANFQSLRIDVSSRDIFYSNINLQWFYIALFYVDTVCDYWETVYIGIFDWAFNDTGRACCTLTVQRDLFGFINASVTVRFYFLVRNFQWVLNQLQVFLVKSYSILVWFIRGYRLSILVMLRSAVARCVKFLNFNEVLVYADLHWNGLVYYFGICACSFSHPIRH